MSLINQVLQDLEKRHATESEHNALPPHVRAVRGRRQSSVRPVVVVAWMIAAVVVTAVGVFLYGRHAPGNGASPIAAAPAPVPAQEPFVEQRPIAAAPSLAPTTMPATAFNPVSRLSDELSLVAPPPVRKVEPAPAARPEKSRTVPRPEVVAALPPAVPVEVQPAPVPEVSPRAEALAAPPAALPAPPPEAQVPSADSAQGAIDKQMREVAPSERAEIAFRKGVAQIREGRANEAELDFRDALKLDPSHVGALQALLGLLLDSKRNNEAEQLLHKTLEINPRQPRHAMVLARLEVERGDVTSAINTMVGVLPYVNSDPDFHAFLAALLQREGRHREAVDYYRAALRGVPGNGVWMMGLGISLRASGQFAEARDSFQRALASRQLSPELQEFVTRQLNELSAAKKR
jgi:MSHA biogenesis protein MshN